MKTVLKLAIVAVVGAAVVGCTGNVFSLEVGECLDQPDGLEVTNVTKRECDEPHDNEVFALIQVEGDDYPGEAAVESAAIEGCLGAFQPYVGRDFQTSRLDIGWLEPTSDSWSNGDQEVVCMLNDFAGDKLTTSMKDSGE